MNRTKNTKQRNTKRAKRRKKKRISKVFISAVAFFMAAVLVVFCMLYITFRTPFFNIEAIDIEGNNQYQNDYIMQKIGIKIGDKIFNVNKKDIKKSLEEELYIKNARVVYELPDRIYLGIEERNESYAILYNDKYIVVDEDGVVLYISNEESNLLTIESLVDILYIEGEVVEFSEISSFDEIFTTLEYCLTNIGKEIVTKLTMLDSNCIVVNTNYGTNIKIDLRNDVRYQLGGAMDIISDRLSKNQTLISGLIDFTKGNNPIYIDNYGMEE